MDINDRAFGKPQATPCGTCAPLGQPADLELTVSPDGKVETREKVSVSDLSSLLTSLSAEKTGNEYQPDEPIYLQGDPANAVFYIQSGKVKLTATSIEGEEAVVFTLPRGSFLGECCLAGQSLRIATASAVLRSTILRIDKQVMMDLLRSAPEFAEHFLAYVLSRGIRIEGRLVSHILATTESQWKYCADCKTDC